MKALTFDTDQSWRGGWAAVGLTLASALLATSAAVAQPQVELPPQIKIEKARTRDVADRVIIKTVTRQPTEAVLAVVLDPIVPGKVEVLNAAGRVIDQKDCDATGQAEFTLPRNRVYRVRASYEGFVGGEPKSADLKNSIVTRLSLRPQSATLKLRNLPPGAEVLIDDGVRAQAGPGGAVTITGIEPGRRRLAIRHPEYNDLTADLGTIEAGDQLSFPSIPLSRVAKLTLEGPPGATVMIDGEVQGRIRAEGNVTINYRLEEAAERTIAVELTGHHPWSQRARLTPGPRTIAVKLEPVVTSTGVSDFFDGLSLWAAPPEWKTVGDRRNNRLQVRGPALGLLRGKTYRDFKATFTLWLPDGQGATWALRVDEAGRNYYLFHLAGPRSQAQAPKKFYIYLVKDGGAPVEVSAPSPVVADLNERDSYTIEVEVTGNRVQHSITSNATGEKDAFSVWTDTAETREKLLYGSFGLRAFKGETFLVDDLIIEPTKEAVKNQ